MLFIKTLVQPSTIHGMGLFTGEFVARGTPVWCFAPGFDRRFTAAEFSALPEPARRHLRWFAYLDVTTRERVLSGDHACFMNHSGTPNTGAAPDAKPPVTTVTLRDIAAGEELTCDYFAFDAEAADKLKT